MSTRSSEMEKAIQAFVVNQYSTALGYCKRLLETEHENPDIYHLLGMINDQSGKYHEARDNYLACLKLQENSDVRNNLGAIFLELEEFNEAKNQFQIAIEQRPDFDKAYYNLGNLYLKLGQYGSARLNFEKTLEYNPSHTKALNNLASLCLNNEELAHAEQYYLQCLHFNPLFEEALIGLASLYIKQRKLELAKEYLGRILNYNLDHVAANILLAECLTHVDKKSTDAELCYLRCLNANQSHLEVYHKLALIYYYRNIYIGTRFYIDLALASDPNYAPALNTMALVRQELSDYESAEKFYLRAIRENEQCAEVWNNYGHLLNHLGKFALAEKALTKALTINPEYKSAKNNLALTLLALGREAEGWRHYQSRPGLSVGDQYQVPDLETLKKWPGVNLIGEQGIGDEIFFMRFVVELKNYGIDVNYTVNPKLKPIAARTGLFKSVNTISKVDKNSVYIGDLPLILNHCENKIAPSPLLLNPIENLKNKFIQELRALGDPPYIGLTWRAGALQNGKRVGSYVKNIDLNSLVSGLSQLDGTFVALQRNPDINEIGDLSCLLNKPVADFSGLNEDLEEMLAMLDLLDEYICVSNTNLHLRASLNKSCRALISVPTEWRWVTNCNGSRWFPNAILYQQEKNGSWESAMECLAQDLLSKYGNKMKELFQWQVLK